MNIKQTIVNNAYTITCGDVKYITTDTTTKLVKNGIVSKFEQTTVDNLIVGWLDMTNQGLPVLTKDYFLTEVLLSAEIMELGGSRTIDQDKLVKERVSLYEHFQNILTHDVNGYKEWNELAMNAHKTFVNNPTLDNYHLVKKYF